MGGPPVGGGGRPDILSYQLALLAFAGCGGGRILEGAAERHHGFRGSYLRSVRKVLRGEGKVFA